MDSEPAVTIDLGLDRDEPEVEPRPPLTWRRLRPAALAAVVALLLTTGGSGLPPPPALTEIATVPYLTGAPANSYPDRDYLLTGERLVTSTLEAGGANWLVAGHELERGRRVWTYRLPTTRNGRVRAQQQAGLILLSGARTDGTAGMRTVALDTLTGRERWSLPHEVQALHEGDHGLVVDTVYPADALLPDDGHSMAETTYGSPWGQTYSRPPLGTIIGGVTLSTGEVRWRSGPVASVATDPARHFGVQRVTSPDRKPGLAVVTGDGAAELWDLDTGAVRHRFPAAQAHTLQLGAGLLLVRHTLGEVTAYSSEDYQRWWTRPVAETDYFGFCGFSGLICDSTPTHSWIVDRATGARSWRLAQSHNLFEFAGHLVEFAPGGGQGGGRPLRTVDPRTGEPRINLIGWEAAMLWSPGPLLLAAYDRFLGPTWLGLLDASASAPVRLGQVPVGVTDCQLNEAVIVCATDDDELRVWRYRTTLQPEDE